MKTASATRADVSVMFSSGTHRHPNDGKNRSKQLLEEVHPRRDNHKTDVTVRVVHRAVENADDRQKASRRIGSEGHDRFAGLLQVRAPTMLRLPVAGQVDAGCGKAQRMAVAMPGTAAF